MDWDDLLCELDLWAASGRTIAFWWRDDDASVPTEALARLASLAEANRVEIGLAVVPAGFTETLAADIARRPGIAVLQHGFQHRNHASAGERAVECGGERPLEETLAELSRGRAHLARLCGNRFTHILAPPWNNIDPAVALNLGGAGFSGLSTFGPRAQQPRGDGLRVANVHVDPLNWRDGGRFAGVEKALSAIVGELTARRTRLNDPDEPLGLLTHHLQHDEATWDFLQRLLDVTIEHGVARWLPVAEAFSGEPVAAKVEGLP